MVCTACESNNRDVANFCRFCGSKLDDAAAYTEPIVSTPVQFEHKSSQENRDGVSDYERLPFFGLDSINTQLENFIRSQLIRKRQKEIGMPVNDSNPVLIFRGETGTGKSLVAEYFIKKLVKSGCLSSEKIECTTARKFQRLYSLDTDISKYLSDNKPGILLIDEIHNDENYLHELLLGLTEKKTNTVCILLGIKDPIEKFFNDKNELTDLVNFYDFNEISDLNLSKILAKKLLELGFVFDKSVEDEFASCVQEAKHNPDCTYKNGWIVEKEILRKITENQAVRLSLKHNLSNSELRQILLEDLPVSSKIQTVEQILLQLDGLIGMNSVKKTIRELCVTVQNNLKRKELGLSSVNPKIHILLTGNPGTGKTTVARLLGKLFYSMKLLPSDNVVEIDGLGLTAGFVGQTKDKVKLICDKAMGGILFIDEAYYLAGNGDSSNSYGSEAVGTLMKRMEDDRGKFVVIAAGYQNEMGNFLKMNPGLESRFEYKIHIDDYTAQDLFEIFKLNVKKDGFVLESTAGEKSKKAIEEICKNKDKDFGNARTIRSFFDRIKLNLDSRLSKFPIEELTRDSLSLIMPDDIPFEEKIKLNVQDIFSELDSLIGMQKVKDAVHELYDSILINLELEKMGQRHKQIEIHIALTGNPGTGKTTVARILGRLFYAMGLLKNSAIVETDRSKIVAKFVGHTAINMQKLCDDATGGILFIDEVYTLASDDYGREATDTLMKRMEDDRGKFIVVVAGYNNKMNEWMSVNEGLSSRFTHRIHIEDYNTQELYQLFCLYMKQENLHMSLSAEKMASIVIDRISNNRGTDFANGRTIRKLFDSVVRKKNSRVSKLEDGLRSIEILTTIEPEDFNLGEME